MKAGQRVIHIHSFDVSRFFFYIVLWLSFSFSLLFSDSYTALDFLGSYCDLINVAPAFFYPLG